MSAYSDLNDLHAQSGNLYHLLSIVYEASTEIQYVLPNGENDRSAERVSALSILARDECERLDQRIGDAIKGLNRDAEPTSDIKAPTGEHPDADLLEVGKQFNRVRQEQIALFEEVGADESDRTMQRIDLIERKLSVLSDFILSLEPKTVDGLRIVAKVWTACHVSTDGTWPLESSHVDERAVHAVMRWLVEGGAS